MNILIGKTKSVCPKCLKTIDAIKIKKDDGIFLVKDCDIHGHFETLIWEGTSETYEQYGEEKAKVSNIKYQTEVKDGCPRDCGLCKDHEQQICCVLMEVTNRCNLHCPICFASANDKKSLEVPLEKIEFMFDKLMSLGGPFNIQLSGGEPTIRDDLDKIIRIGKKKGIDFFQLNTNGIRIADDIEYLKKLKVAGLNCVFLQFDSFKDEVYKIIRGDSLINKKLKAIENCKKIGIGVVLVPTVVPNVNENEVGEIIKFAFENLPYIRGVHFQPVSYFGRINIENIIENNIENNLETKIENELDVNSALRIEDNKNKKVEITNKSPFHITIPRILAKIEETTGSVCKISDFVGGGAENSYCSFHANYYLDEKGNIKLLKGNSQGDEKTSSNSRTFVKGKWGLELNDVEFDYKTSDKKT